MRLRPNYTEPHLNLGFAYEEKGYYGLAELQLRTALSPLNIRARNELGHLFLQSCRLEAAEEQFRRSVESEPSVAGYVGLGEVFARLNDLARAELAYKLAVAADPYDSRAHFGLGKIYMDTGRDSEARREFQAGLVTDPKNSEALAALEKLRRRPRDAKNPPQ